MHLKNIIVKPRTPDLSFNSSLLSEGNNNNCDELASKP